MEDTPVYFAFDIPKSLKNKKKQLDKILYANNGTIIDNKIFVGRNYEEIEPSLDDSDNYMDSFFLFAFGDSMEDVGPIIDDSTTIEEFDDSTDQIKFLLSKYFLEEFPELEQSLNNISVSYQWLVEHAYDKAEANDEDAIGGDVFKSMLIETFRKNKKLVSFIKEVSVGVENDSDAGYGLNNDLDEIDPLDTDEDEDENETSEWKSQMYKSIGKKGSKKTSKKSNEGSSPRSPPGSPPRSPPRPRSKKSNKTDEERELGTHVVRAKSPPPQPILAIRGDKVKELVARLDTITIGNINTNGFPGTKTVGDFIVDLPGISAAAHAQPVQTAATKEPTRASSSARKNDSISEQALEYAINNIDETRVSVDRPTKGRKYYDLKQLSAFCQDMGLNKSGNKETLVARVLSVFEKAKSKGRS